MNTRDLLFKYLLKESGLVKVLQLSNVADDAALIAKLGAGTEAAKNIKLVSKYMDNVADLENILKSGGHNIDFPALKTAIQDIVDGTGTNTADALLKIRDVKRAINTEVSAGNLRKIGSGGGGGPSPRLPRPAPSPIDLFTKELERARQLEAMGQKSAAKTIREQASVKYGFPLDDELKSVDEYLKEIEVKRKAGLNSEAERLEAEMLRKHGGSKFERLKLWVKNNKVKAGLLGLSAVALAYFLATSGEKSPTPSPGGGGGGGGGGGAGRGCRGGIAKSCSSDKLKHGCVGENVKPIQQQLIDCGFPLPKFGVDGKFCSETRSATMAFQKSVGLAVDGIAGPNTQEALKKCNVSKTPEPEQPVEPKLMPVPAEEPSKITGGTIGGGEITENINRFNIIKNRHEKLEKLVFERLVKGCK